MLKLLRHKNVAKVVLWGILLLIMPAFVLWGTGNLGGSKEKGPSFAGTINNKKVSFKDFGDSVASVRCHLILNYFNQPKVMDEILQNKSFVGNLAWDRLVMLREANSRKIKVPNSDIIGYLKSHPLFLRNGQFDEKIYGYVLRNNVGLDARAFEEIVRENLAIHKLSESVTKGVQASDKESALAEWLGKLRADSKLNIDLGEYAKYYD